MVTLGGFLDMQIPQAPPNALSQNPWWSLWESEFTFSQVNLQHQMWEAALTSLFLCLKCPRGIVRGGGPGKGPGISLSGTKTWMSGKV